MRRKRNEVTELAEIVDIIKRCDCVRIAMYDDKYPYIVPLNFGEEVIGDTITLYIHMAHVGKKVDLLSKNPYVCFEMDCNHGLYYRQSNRSCNFQYESIIGTGKVEVVEENEKEHALTVLMQHYHSKHVEYNPKFLTMTKCMKIEVKDINAKRSMPQKDIPDYEMMQFKGNVDFPHM